MIIELIVIAAAGYISGRGTAKTAETALEFAEGLERVSVHTLAGERFVIKNQSEYRVFKSAADAINQLVGCGAAELNLSEEGQRVYRLLLVRGIIAWGLYGAPTYEELISNVEDASAAPEIALVSTNAWRELNSCQLSHLFLLAQYYETYNSSSL